MFGPLFYILAMAWPVVLSQTFSPAMVPLAVRSPYLSAWLDARSGPTSDVWPLFWDDSSIEGWSGYVQVDGVTYQWLGESGTKSNLTNTIITPTRSILTIQAGPLILNATFLSPIDPDDWVRQSLPFAYLYVEVASTDGQPHSVQLYSDISAEWVSGDRSNEAQWNTTQTSACVYHQASRATMAPMQETNNIAEDSTVYYAMATTPNMTWQSGAGAAVRGQFANSGGRLLNTPDTNFRAIQNNFPVFGIAVNLGDITATSSPVVWALGLVRDPSILSVDESGHPQNRSTYFWTEFPTITAAIEDVVSNFPNAQNKSIALDERITNDASAISPDYRDLLSLATRQAMGGTEITVSKGSDGQWDLSDIQVFMKDIGNGRRVNPVEVVYASFPMFLYLNSSLGGLLLSPLLQYQNSKSYRNPYAAPDIGSTYPNAIGDNADSHVHGVENSGSMLIMTLAHARISGDGSLIRKYYPLLKRWADYLVSNSLTLTDQTTFDNLNEPNMTNLAIKGIIGIQAMSEISRVSGMSSDSQHYASQASSYVTQWQNLAFSSGHLLSSFSQPSSWGLIYNLFADRLLQTNLVNQTIYDAQTSFYNSIAASASQFGLEYDSNAQGEARSDWTAFTASTCTSDAAGNATRDQLLSMVHARASFNQTAGAFPVLYDVNTGNSSTGQASPAQGAMFAALSLNLANRTITVPPPFKKHVNVAVIVGPVVGGVFFVLTLVLGILFFRRREARRSPNERRTQIIPTPFDTTVNSRTGPWNKFSGPSRHLVHPHTTTLTSSNHERTTSGKSSLADGSSGLDNETTTQLRDQVEALRREMEALRSRSAFGEAPPSYV